MDGSRNSYVRLGFLAVVLILLMTIQLIQQVEILSFFFLLPEIEQRPKLREFLPAIVY
jgi:hypothetical protein